MATLHSVCVVESFNPLLLDFSADSSICEQSISQRVRELHFGVEEKLGWSKMGRVSPPAFVALVVVASFLAQTWVVAGQQCGSQAGFARCNNNQCCSQFGFCGTTFAYCGTGCQNGPCTGGRASSTKLSGGGLESTITREFFDQQFSSRNQFYTYDSLIEAADSLSSAGLGTTGDVTVQKREVAAFLAHIDHETSGLAFIKEQNPTTANCKASMEFPCASGKSYYGRGPSQLSGNLNYGSCGQAIGQDLLNNPDLVAENPTIAFKTAIWSWSTPQGQKPSCHAVMTGGWTPSADDIAANRQPGFGLTTNIINGALECNTHSASADNRVAKYQSFCSLLGVDPGQNLSCEKHSPFA